MPIPYTPYTRKEAYLNAVATGDSSGIPETPYTREEMYLDAIAKGGSGGGGSSTLAGLTDVDISNPSDGQTLVFDATSQKWKNGSVGGGGGVLVVNMDIDTFTLDKTWQEIADAPLAVIVYPDPDGDTETDKCHDTVGWVGVDGDFYIVKVYHWRLGTLIRYDASSANDYPVCND